MEGNLVRDAIRLVDVAAVDETQFVRRFVGCIVLSHDDEILLQQRDPSGCRFPDCLGTFGGSVEKDETPVGALIRELKEELGAQVDPAGLVKLGVFTEAATGHKELIYGYFWHDAYGTVTGCYEGKMGIYNTCAAALAHPKITEDARWLLEECRRRDLF